MKNMKKRVSNILMTNIKRFQQIVQNQKQQQQSQIRKSLLINIKMIDTSSKRLSKIKKKLNKNQTSDYFFLISSLQRDSNKQNYASNHLNLNKTSLRNSIELKKSSMVNSFDNFKHLRDDKNLNSSQIYKNRECTKINIKNSHSSNVYPPFFENVKFLKNSRVLDEHCPELKQNKFVLSTTGYQKNIQLSQNFNSKQFHQTIKQPKSNKFTQDLSDSFEHKIQSYVEFVNELLDEIVNKFKIEKSNCLSRKKCLLQALGKQLLRQAKKTPDMLTMKNLSKSIEVSNFTSFPSKAMSRQLQRSINQKQRPQQGGLNKIINELSHQNTKLTQLISEHERQSIKMFIQMNQNESKQIERCKKYLSTLYDKYKLLEKSLVKENQKYKKVCQEKKQLQKKFTDLEAQNTSLSEEMEKIKGMFEQINNQTMSKLSFEEDSHSNTIFNFNLIQNNQNQQNKLCKNNQSVTHQQSQQLNSKMDKSFITKRDKASSCLSRHLDGEVIKNKDEQIMSCSTITKTKNMKKKKPQTLKTQKISIGVNLKDQFNQILQDELITLRKEINSLKERMNEETVLKLALQKQLVNLESTLKKRTQKTQKMQGIINDQLGEIQKLMEVNCRLTNELKSSTINNIKPPNSNGSRKQALTGSQQVFEQINKLNKLKNVLNPKEPNPSRRSLMQSEYRIIAMQAGILQVFINQSQ